MVELKCPRCRHRHWQIDNDFRGSALVGQRELSYKERTYACPACGEASTGYRVLQRSPPEFFLQPHPMYRMTTRKFARWLAVFRAQFPSDERLRSVGVFWYPGEAGDEQKWKLHDACQVGTVRGYRLSLSNHSPDDERIRVCVQWEGGEAHFWCGSHAELDRCYFGLERAGEIETIRELLAARAPDIRQAWQRFSQEAKDAREQWLPKLRSRVPALPAVKRWAWLNVVLLACFASYVFLMVNMNLPDLWLYVVVVVLLAVRLFYRP